MNRRAKKSPAIGHQPGNSRKTLNNDSTQKSNELKGSLHNRPLSKYRLKQMRKIASRTIGAAFLDAFWEAGQ